MSIYICLFLSYIFIYKTFTFFFKLLHVWESAAQGVAFFQACPLVKHPAFFKLCQRSAISEVVFFCFLSSPFRLPPSEIFWVHLLLLPLFHLLLHLLVLLLLGHCLLLLLGLCLLLLWRLFLLLVLAVFP